MKNPSKNTDHTAAVSRVRQLPTSLQGLAGGSLAILHKLTKVGTALSAERKIDSLLEMIVEEAKELTGADGATLYIMSPDKTQLQFAIVETDRLNIKMGGKGGKITWPPIPLKNSEGLPNHSHVCAHAALTKTTISIDDVYEYKDFNFEGTRNFDRSTGYRSRSMLVVPMKNHEDEVIGILQLINAHKGTKIVPFSPVSAEIAKSFASQAAVAFSNTLLVQELETLLEAFIRIIAFTIDEKSPYTGGHVRRVADMTMKIARKINEQHKGFFSDIRFSEDELKELQISAWLHDVGKIIIPEHILDKETRLQAICDRIELIKHRFELLRLNALLTKSAGEKALAKNSEQSLRDEFNFLMDTNVADSPPSKETLARIKRIAKKKYPLQGKMESLLSADEVEHLSIPSGTLTSKERQIIQNHAMMTYRILSQLPFPEKMKDVPQYASFHHERPNGTGYPNGLTAEQIPLQARIIALADVFDALMSGDRPYKRGKTLSEVMELMEKMASNLDIDPDIFALFKNEGLYLEYPIGKS